MMPPTPPAIRRALRLATALLLVVAATLIALIVAGGFDPRPAGSPVQRTSPGPLALESGGEMLARQPLPWPSPPTRYSVRLTAAHAAGATDSAYGLALGDGVTLTVAVSPLGEAAVWQTIAGDDEPRYLMPWQPWPHVRPGIAANEIWLDVRKLDDMARVTARINRELLWEGEVEQMYPGVALWLGSFGSRVSVDFQTLDWFAVTEE